MPPVTMVDVAALVATLLAACAGLPQLHRVLVGRDERGVSLTAPAIGAVNEATWILYAWVQGLWSAIPEAVLMTLANVALVVGLSRRRSAGSRRAMVAAGTWAAVFVTVALTGGPVLVGVVLGWSYAVQVTPAVVAAWRTEAPTGVAATTWAIVLVESVLWGVYGLAHGDPATSILAASGTIAASLILVRKAVSVGRPAGTDPADVLLTARSTTPART